MWLRAAGYSYLGIFFGVSIILGYLGGAYLDRRFQIKPWGSFCGLLLGIAASFKELYRLTMQHKKETRGGTGA